METRVEGLAVGFAGCIAAVLLAGVLVPFRTDAQNANVALVLVVVVVVTAAFGGRLAGAVASVGAAVSYDFFHTAPFNTLRILDVEDIVTVLLILVVGVSVGELTELRARAVARAQAQSADLRALLRTAERAGAAGARIDELWPEARSALVGMLGLRACRFEPAGRDAEPLPQLDHEGRLAGTRHVHQRGGFELPPEGVELVVEHGGVRLGRLVLIPTPGRGVSRDARRAAVVVADQLASVLAGTPEALRPLG